MMNTNSFSMETSNILHSYYVKYLKLRELVDMQYAGSDATQLNFIIDLRLLSSVDEILSPKTIGATIINIIAHYRSFFRTRYGVNTKIWLIYDTRVPASRNVGLALNDLKMTCPFINDVSLEFIDNEVGVKFVEIYNYETSSGNIYPWMILTKDILMTQLINQNVCILRPKKVKGQDESYIINAYNVMHVLSMELRSKNIDNRLNFGHISLLFALTRVPGRLKSYIRVDTAVRMILDAVDRKLILNGYNNSDFAIETVCSFNPKADPSVVMSRLAQIDYNLLLLSFPPANKYNGIINLYDSDLSFKLENYYGRGNIDFFGI